MLSRRDALLKEHHDENQVLHHEPKSNPQEPYQLADLHKRTCADSASRRGTPRGHSLPTRTATRGGTSMSRTTSGHPPQSKVVIEAPIAQSAFLRRCDSGELR